MKKVVGLILLILLLATFSDRPPLLAYKQQLFGWFSTKTQTASQIRGEQKFSFVASRAAAIWCTVRIGTTTGTATTESECGAGAGI